jgi:glycosyltransferase involved in cell wall biosynthesis
MPSQLKVLHICHSLRIGGLEQVVLDLVRLGPKFGFQSAVATLAASGELAPEVKELGSPFYLLGKREGLDWRMVARIRGLIKSLGIDVVHAHNEGAGLYAGLAGLWTRRPVITTRHGLSFGVGGPWLRRVAGLVNQRTVCVGRDVMRMAREGDRIPGRKLRLIYNGVETGADLMPDSEREKIRTSLGLDAEALMIISVGRLSPEKDYQSLLQTLAQIAPATAAPFLVLVGDGPQRNDLARTASELGMKDRVLLLGQRRDVPQLLAAADIFALSSISEGVSKAILEALAMGLVVVATAVGGTPELIEDGVTGILVPPSRPDIMAQALSRVLADPQLAERLGRAGQLRVEQSFSLRATVQAYSDLYRQVAASE